MQKKQINGQKRFFRFAVVGVSGTIVDFSIFNILSVAIGLQIITSSIVSFIVAVVNNFIWNRNWTYPESKNRSLSEQLLKFSIVSILGLLIRTPLFALIENPLINFAVGLLGQQFFIKPEIMGHNFALATVIVIVLFWNYFINRLWTYKDLK
ncbi:MAG: GtrA family protein [Anaerolineaceae bacterium]|nr:GtrA family protein [Anaerolineaceae bacterium]